MTMSGKEAIAGVRVLVCVAKADGAVHDEERKALAAALDGAPLPIGMTVDTLLAESIDLDAQLAYLATPEAKEHVFESACSMAYADGTCSPEEQAMLDRIQAALGVSRERGGAVSTRFAEARESILPTTTQPIADAARRSTEVQAHTLRCAVLCALLGGAPTDGVSIDLCTLALQLKLVRDIGRYHGQELDPKAAQALLAGLGIGTAAQMAVSNLAKVVPGWSSGAPAAFAATFGLGKVVDSLFSSGGMAGALAGGAGLGQAKAALAGAEKEGRLAYEENRAAIAARVERTRAALKTLDAQLASRAIDQAEYDRRVAALA